MEVNVEELDLEDFLDLPDSLLQEHYTHDQIREFWSEKLDKVIEKNFVRTEEEEEIVCKYPLTESQTKKLCYSIKCRVRMHKANLLTGYIPVKMSRKGKTDQTNPLFLQEAYEYYKRHVRTCNTHNERSVKKALNRRDFWRIRKIWVLYNHFGLTVHRVLRAYKRTGNFDELLNAKHPCDTSKLPDINSSNEHSLEIILENPDESNESTESSVRLIVGADFDSDDASASSSVVTVINTQDSNEEVLAFGSEEFVETTPYSEFAKGVKELTSTET